MPDGSRTPAERRDLSKPQRIFVPLEHKSAEETADAWIVRGIATTPRMDRMGDIVRPLGAQFDRAHMPKLLLYHDATSPVGTLTELNVKSTGIPFAARIPKVLEPGVVRDRIEEAVHSVKYDLISYTSIGFNPLEFEPIDKADPMSAFFGPFDFKKWELLELSLVTIPAQPDAVITGIKSIDDALRNARSRRKHFDMGRQVVPDRSTTSPSNTPAGASAITTPKGNTMHAKLAGLVESRKTAAARMAELAALKDTEARGYTETEATEIDTLDVQVKELDRDIKVTSAQVEDASTAVPVEAKGAGRGAPYGFVRKQDPDDKFKGQAGTRMVIVKALAHLSMKEGNYLRPSEIAQMRWGKTNPMLCAVIKANEVAGGGAGSGEWGAELVSADNRFTGDFVQYLYSKTIFDRLPLRQVPANVSIKGQDGAFVGYWVGESKPIPMSPGDFSTQSLTPLKVAALTVMSNELLRDSSPAAEGLVRDGLEEASRQRIDATFLSASAISAGVSPAGILNGVSAKASNGPDAQSIMTDWRALIGDFITAKNTGGLQIVTTPAIAEGLGSMRNALGADEFPGLTSDGGTFRNRPVLTGDNVGTGDFILLSPSDIWRIGDLGVRITVSQDATIEQSSAPVGATDTPVAMTQAMTSMFQEESTAFKVVRPINFVKRRSSAVAYVGDAAYGAEAS